MREHVMEIVAKEIAALNDKAAKADAEGKVMIGGAVAEMLHVAGRPDEVCTDYLRRRYKDAASRAKNRSLPDRELCRLARGRAAFVAESLARIGKEVAEIEKRLLTK